MITRVLTKSDGTRRAEEHGGAASMRFFIFFEGKLVPEGGNLGWRRAQDKVTLYAAMGKIVSVKRMQDGTLHENAVEKGVIVC